MSEDMFCCWKKKRFELLGVPVDPVDANGIIQLLCYTVERDVRLNLCHANLHGIYCAQYSDEMYELYRNDQTIVHIDGMPIIWLGRTVGANVRDTDRNTHVDLIPFIIDKFAERGWPMGFLGSRRDQVDENLAALRKLNANGVYHAEHGYFGGQLDQGEEDKIIKRINDHKCKILFVGMGMPLQEEWIHRNRGRIDSPIVMPVGGFIDYYTGRCITPPRVLGRMGLEGLCRLLSDPRRLGYRYLVEPAVLLGMFASRTHRKPKA